VSTNQPNRRLIVAGRSARALAESASRAGWQVTAVDAAGSLDLEAFAEVVTLGRDHSRPWTPLAAARIGRVVPAAAVAYTADFENHPAAISRLADAHRLLGNAPGVLERVRDPVAMADTLRARGFAVPAVRTDPAPGAPAGAWLLKPRSSCGGEGIAAWSPGQPVPAGWVLQERITGRPGSLLFAADGRTAVPLGVTRKLVGVTALGAEGFRYSGSVLGSPTTPCFDDHAAVVDAALAIAQALTAAYGLVGLNGLDFVVCRGVPVPIELNPRFTAAMELLERAHGVSVFDIHASACDGRLPRAELAHRPASVAFGQAIVHARAPGRLGDTRGWLRDPSVRDVPPPGATVAAGTPICTVFAEAGDAAACRRALVRRAAAVYREVEPLLAHASGA
jgi:predicted ATP-grasp superfamily ATP-dependent carboligase